mgnify:CR=1 FL=1
MKNLVLTMVLVAMVSGCSLFRKKTTGTESGDGVVSETTASGSSEKVDASPLNFSAGGSDSGSITGLQTVHFDFDASTLTEAEKAKLTGNVEWLNKNSGVKLLIEGHCDQRGSTEYNLSLGERRANAVKSMMISMGVKPDRLSTTSLGEEKLIANGDSEEEMAKNRRANFVPTKK